jgi:chaperonin GroEL
MERKVIYGIEGLKAIKKGIDKVATIVGSTLGPRGRTVLISMATGYDDRGGLNYLPLHSTLDGVTCARSMTLSDGIENIGAKLIREAAEETLRLAGDGTSSTCVLMQAIVEKGLELVEAGVNVMELKKGIESAVEYVVSQLKEQAIMVGDDLDKIKQVATVSAHNDIAIGELIAEAYSKIGVDGVIDIQAANIPKTELKTEAGFKFNKGMLSPYFITDQSKNEAVLEEPYILLYDKTITTYIQIQPVLTQVMQANKSLLIICEDSEGEALAVAALNTYQKRIKCCIVKAPNFGHEKRETMEDAAISTGSLYVSELKGVGLKEVKLNHHVKLAKKAIITADSTIIIGGERDEKKYQDYILNLRANLALAETDEDREHIEKRIARLVGGVAVISVGGVTETEMKEKLDRIDDAVRATKSAIQEGYVIGGGCAFLKIPPSIERYDTAKSQSQSKGWDLVYNAVKSPIKQICLNAGIDYVDVLDKVELTDKNLGYNAKDEKVEDLIAAGIIDPVKVLRCSLQNAASAAIVALTSGGLIVDVQN